MIRTACSGLLFCVLSTATVLSAQAFQPQTRLGASLPGDTWEPSIAADRFGHVYALIPDFPPSCKGCASSTAYLVASNDNGRTWSAPRPITDPGVEQIDVQVKVDPVDGETVYASWLENNKSVISQNLRTTKVSIIMANEPRKKKRGDVTGQSPRAERVDRGPQPQPVRCNDGARQAGCALSPIHSYRSDSMGSRFAALYAG